MKPILCRFLTLFIYIFSFSYKLNTFKALESWLRIGAISLENIDKSEVMHEAFSTLANVQGKKFSKTIDCIKYFIIL